jgi:hypothetical protein
MSGQPLISTLGVIFRDPNHFFIAQMEVFMKAVVTLLAFITITLSASAADKPNRKLAIEYLEAAQFENVIDASIEAYSRQLLTQLPAEERRPFQKMMNETLGWAATKNQIADLVIDVYTTEELKSYITFSNTKAGRSYNEKSADFSNKFSVVLSRNIQKFIENDLVRPAKQEEAQRVPK